MLLVQTVSSGIGFYNMSVYINEFAKLLDLSVADISFAVSLFFVTGGVAGIYVARLIDRVDVRWIMATGTVICGVSLYWVGQIQHLWQLYVLFVVFGVGNTGVSLIITTTLITRWFPGRNRSVALSISSTGLSLGGVLITPITARLFNSTSVAETMPMLALVFVVFILPIALWVVRMPGSVVQSKATAGGGEWTYRSAIRTRFFVLLAIGYMLCMGAQVGGIAHIYSRVEGVSDFATAALAVQVLSVCSIFGRFIGGIALLWLPLRGFTLVMLVIQMVGLGYIGYASTPAMAIVGAGILGVSVGNLLMLQPLWLADAFPGSQYPRVFAFANALSVFGVACGPFFMGLAYDSADYLVAYVGAVIMSMFAWVIIAFAGSGPHRKQSSV